MEPPHQPRPRRLPEISGGGTHYVAEDQKQQLLAKYGDLTRPSVLPSYMLNVPLAARVPAPAPPAPVLGRTPGRARDDSGEYVLRREMEERLSQMDMRISMLANALRQQDELSQRMQQALDEVLAKTAALPQPRPARSALSGILMGGGGGMLDAGGMVVPDPTGGGMAGGGPGGGGHVFPFGDGGGGAAPLGLGGHHHLHGLLPAGLDVDGAEEEGEEEDHHGEVRC